MNIPLTLTLDELNALITLLGQQPTSSGAYVILMKLRGQGESFIAQQAEMQQRQALAEAVDQARAAEREALAQMKADEPSATTDFGRREMMGVPVGYRPNWGFDLGRRTNTTRTNTTRTVQDVLDDAEDGGPASQLTDNEMAEFITQAGRGPHDVEALRIIESRTPRPNPEHVNCSCSNPRGGCALGYAHATEPCGFASASMRSDMIGY